MNFRVPTNAIIRCKDRVRITLEFDLQKVMVSDCVTEYQKHPSCDIDLDLDH